ncbi:MAG: glycosyltransferase family 2 protein [Methylocystis sp.]|nr:glycosyltransferase family 2 protein [Methylocystis sp.]MCA3582140.1 glycosyltransferase family 2 protein [Methylocystis sp.]MCA3587882.1 glycosyltransferase family 2 protein [Methylocystis sp.]MCA3593361.1 glycosyltransferase family 2 protein [Methylocystis sp.]
MKLTAILVTYNSAAVLAEAQASLPAGTAALVADNGSTDDSIAIAEAAGAKVIRNGVNLGFGKANNIGLRAALTEWVLLLNPDARLEAGFLEAMEQAVAMRPDAALLVPAITTSRGPFRKWSSILTPQGFEGRAIAPGIRSIGFASGGVLLARRDALRAIGGFDEDIFLYFEDDDLSRRALDAGHEILLVEGAKATHIGNVSTPPSPELTAMKQWHLAWSERHVRKKFGMIAPGYWRIAECFVKMLWARLRGDAMESAKQFGLVNGTLAHMRGVKAQDMRDRAGLEGF